MEASKIKDNNLPLEKQLHLAKVFNFVSEQTVEGGEWRIVMSDKAYQKLMRILEKNKLNIL